MMLPEFVSHNADYLTTGRQAGFLGCTVRTTGIAGNQSQSLFCRMTTNRFRKGEILRIQFSTAYQRNGWGIQNGQVTLCPEGSGAVQSQTLT